MLPGEKPYCKRGQCLMEQTLNGRISGDGSNPLFWRCFGIFQIALPRQPFILATNTSNFIFKRNLCNRKLFWRKNVYPVVTPVPCIRICCNVTKLSSTIAFHCLLILLSLGDYHYLGWFSRQYKSWDALVIVKIRVMAGVVWGWGSSLMKTQWVGWCVSFW